MKILISDNLSKVGVDLLRRNERFQVEVNRAADDGWICPEPAPP